MNAPAIGIQAQLPVRDQLLARRDPVRREATLDPAAGTLELTDDPRSLQIRKGLRGRGLMDALKMRDDVEVHVEGRLS